MLASAIDARGIRNCRRIVVLRGSALIGDGKRVYVASTSTGISVQSYIFEYKVSPLQRVRRFRFVDGTPSALAIGGPSLA